MTQIQKSKDSLTVCGGLKGRYLVTQSPKITKPKEVQHSSAKEPKDPKN